MDRFLACCLIQAESGFGVQPDMDFAGAEVNEKQHVKSDQPCFGPDLLGKKIGGPGHVQVGLDEGPVTRGAPTFLNPPGSSVSGNTNAG
jgi:hypothetical protein